MSKVIRDVAIRDWVTNYKEEGYLPYYDIFKVTGSNLKEIQVGIGRGGGIEGMKRELNKVLISDNLNVLFVSSRNYENDLYSDFRRYLKSL